MKFYSTYFHQSAYYIYFQNFCPWPKAPSNLVMLHSSDDFFEVDISSITFHGVLLAKDRVQSLKNVQFAARVARRSWLSKIHFGTRAIKEFLVSSTCRADCPSVKAKSKTQNTVHTCFNWREKSKENLPVSRTHQRY